MGVFGSKVTCGSGTRLEGDECVAVTPPACAHECPALEFAFAPGTRRSFQNANLCEINFTTEVDVTVGPGGAKTILDLQSHAQSYGQVPSSINVS